MYFPIHVYVGGQASTEFTGYSSFTKLGHMSKVLLLHKFINLNFPKLKKNNGEIEICFLSVYKWGTDYSLHFESLVFWFMYFVFFLLCSYYVHVSLFITRLLYVVQYLSLNDEPDLTFTFFLCQLYTLNALLAASVFFCQDH